MTPTAPIQPSAVRYNPGDSDVRPWGRWEVLATGSGYTVKRITVAPGQRLSLQYHNYRAEHWTVVTGVAEVEIDGSLQSLTNGEHVHIPLNATHRIRNVGDSEMVFIEVQYGAVLDENDIVRVTDDYGRCVPA
ncbi:mannose-6-phosphate isomerase [Methylobacterium radiotolerans]|nr:mannose-6-phosphate isomerase [Methylobacterium radiotolerans]